MAFGSGVERTLFPTGFNPTRLGIEQTLRGEPHRGPGCYDPDPVSGGDRFSNDKKEENSENLSLVRVLA